MIQVVLLSNVFNKSEGALDAKIPQMVYNTKTTQQQQLISLD